MTSPAVEAPGSPKPRGESNETNRTHGTTVRHAVKATRQATLFDRARNYLEQLPPAISGQSGHDQTYRAACVLIQGFGLARDIARPLLAEYSARCKPPWSTAELDHKLADAERTTDARGRGYLLRDAGTRPSFRPTTCSPPVEPTAAGENFLCGFRATEVDLWETSPIRPPDDWRQDALALLALLYDPGEQVNFVTEFAEDKGKARPSGRGETVERDTLLARWRKSGLPSSEAGGWLRMNPLDGQGIGDANVTAFRFALVEFDSIAMALQLSLVARLPMPIAALLTSGGRSLHAWVRVDAPTLADYRQTTARLLDLLGKFGADGKNKNASRLSRLPGVCRRLGATGDGRQRLLYLNPQPPAKAIL